LLARVRALFARGARFAAFTARSLASLSAVRFFAAAMAAFFARADRSSRVMVSRLRLPPDLAALRPDFAHDFAEEGFGFAVHTSLVLALSSRRLQGRLCTLGSLKPTPFREPVYVIGVSGLIGARRGSLASLAGCRRIHSSDLIRECIGQGKSSGRLSR